MTDCDVLIVGGGMAGLACASHLHEARISFRLLEAADAVGGRVRTDVVDGFRLDRGFQVLLTAYPEAQRILDFPALNLQEFEPGALVRFKGKFHRFVDPWRRPGHFFSTALSSLATIPDKFRMARLRSRLCRGSLEQLLNHPETTTLEALRNDGFSEKVIDRFFRPFLGGVFLEPELTTSSRKFEFVFRMFSQGYAALPAQGMEELARQIADRLPAGSIHTNLPVERIEGHTVHLVNGEQHSAKSVVVAVDSSAAARLFGEETQPGCHVSCLYFAASRAPIEEPILVLNGDGQGPINNLCIPSQVSPAYAPDGQSLISVSILDDSLFDESLLQNVNTQLRDWFGEQVDHWRHLKTYRIPYALPAQPPPALSPVTKSIRRADGLFVCGDYLDIASLQGAMVSGRRVAETVISDTMRQS